MKRLAASTRTEWVIAATEATPLSSSLAATEVGRVAIGLRRLAGFEEEERDAMVAHHARDPVGVYQLAAAALELVQIRRVFETELAQVMSAVVDAVAIEVDHVIRLAPLTGILKFLFERREGWGLEKPQAGEVAKPRQRFHQRTGADAVVDVRGGLVLWPRAHQQNANRRLGCHGALAVAVRKPAPDAHRPRTLEKIALLVMDQLPGQAEQQCGRFVRFSLLFRRRSRDQFALHLDREPPFGRSGSAPGIENGAGGLGVHAVIQLAAPFRQGLFDFACPLQERLRRPVDEPLEIPLDLSRLDGTERRRKPVALAFHLAALRRSENQSGNCDRAAFSLELLDCRVGEFENEVGDRRGLSLNVPDCFRGRMFANGCENLR